VKFNETNLKGLYNLAFGDKDVDTGEINDLAISNNGDSEKVLRTCLNIFWGDVGKLVKGS
jgi:hypothetical protein